MAPSEERRKAEAPARPPRKASADRSLSPSPAGGEPWVTGPGSAVRAFGSVCLLALLVGRLLALLSPAI